MNTGFWRGKRVFLTGHTGFKGSWMCLLLERLRAEVTGFSQDPPTRPSLFQLARIADSITSICGDVRDLAQLTAAVESARPDIVIHMAAQPLVRRSYRKPVETFSTNVLGTVNVLEAIRQVGGVRAVVSVTTDKCYQNREMLWGYRENEPVGGHDPYSASKACAELVTEAYRKSFFQAPHPQPLSPKGARGDVICSLASARAGNVIGGGDWAEDRLIPDFIRACEGGLTIEIRSPTAIRPWQHVLEPLSGYLTLAERLHDKGVAFAEAWNFGPHDRDARPVRYIVNQLVELWGEGAAWRLSDGDHPHEAHYLKLDCTKANSRLGWFPRTDLDTALRWIVDWHKRVRLGENARAVSIEQIDQFLTLEHHVQWNQPVAGFAKAS
jgi:CDP-glucose 4,6-dehydratase